MILGIDMGNTNIVIGCIDDEKLYFTERLSTDKSRTDAEYAMTFKMLMELNAIDTDMIEGAIISSVVPPLTDTIIRAVNKITGITPIVVGPGIKTGIDIKTDNPASVGSDLIVDAVAGAVEYGSPLVIIDMGTATTMSVIDRNGTYIGGIIAPGVRVSMEALVSMTSQLNKVGIDKPDRVIGRNTAECMKSGLVVGAACMIDSFIERIEEELGYPVSAVATGGLSNVVVPLCKRPIIIDNNLLLKGLKIIYDKNMKK